MPPLGPPPSSMPLAADFVLTAGSSGSNLNERLSGDTLPLELLEEALGEVAGEPYSSSLTCSIIYKELPAFKNSPLLPSSVSSLRAEAIGERSSANSWSASSNPPLIPLSKCCNPLKSVELYSVVTP